MIPIMAIVKKWRGKICLAFLFRVSIYTPQSKVRVTQCFSPYVNYLLCSVAQTRKDIEKRFAASFKKRFQSKIGHLKFSFSSFAEFAFFAKISKIMFYPFY